MRLRLSRPLIAAALFFSTTVLLTSQNTASDDLRGFSPADAQQEMLWEQRFRAIPNTANLRENMHTLSLLPHHVGSARDRQNAEWILAKLRSWGWDAQIEQFETLFPTPQDRLLELVQPQQYTAILKEPPVAVDPNSTDPGQLPTYNAFSADGDVTAPLVYVNYGVPDDYDKLKTLGVDVRGKIVITRYGGSWRGIKPKVAYEHGAVGCLIYSDPHDDGYAQGDVFPQGAFRPIEGVQRGSVVEMEIYPGDPETPGWGSVPGARRLSMSQAQTLEKIPVLPISYGDALPLLKSLTGPVAPEEWRGSLPITYHVGPGAGVAHLRLKFNWNIAPLYDVIGRIRGSEAPDEWVIRGNHHDAWVNGAEDPISGQSALLEEARALGTLVKQGWRPKRTIIYAAWDGEEPGLLGSTEWVETHAQELAQHAIVYINSDSNGKSHLEIGGSHTLEHAVNNIAKDIQLPGNQSAWMDAKVYRLNKVKTDEDRKDLISRPDLRIGAMGSGSDYSPFLQHAGIASLSMAYQQEDANGGIYHSIYDDFYWYTHFSDTSFVYGRALSQTIGTTVMRFADADVLPFQFTNFADTIAKYQKELQKYMDDQRKKIADANAIPGAVQQPPIPQFDFSPLQQAVTALTNAATTYERDYQAAASSGRLFQKSAADRDALNQLLFQSERKLLNPAGLPRRPWYKHQIYAPGFYTGYGVKTLPGLREALEQKNWTEATQEQNVIVQALAAFTAQIEAARARL